MNNRKVAIFIADGFEEIEALTVVDILRRGKVHCDTIALKNTMVAGSHNIIVMADKILKEIDKDEYDMIVLPGGKIGADNLRDSKEIIEIIKEFNEKNKFIAAICAAPQVLEKAGIIKGKKVTSYPSEKYKDILKESNYVNDLVVIDDNIITSRGPATTFSFAYQLLELLGEDSNDLKESMLYNELYKNINKK